MKQLVLAHSDEDCILVANLYDLDQGLPIEIFISNRDDYPKHGVNPAWIFIPEYNESSSRYYGRLRDGSFAILERNGETLFLHVPKK